MSKNTIGCALRTEHTATSADGCFAAGTLVHTDQGLVPIQDIKVGDMVLAKPESGEGETSYKPVLNTFVHENKELWLFEAVKHWNNKDINGKRINSELHRFTSEKSEFIVTPNHSVWVVGKGRMGNLNLDEIISYPQPQWKRVDQLLQHEIVVNKDGVLFYIKKAQPLYQYKDNQIGEVDLCVAWYQHNYYVSQDPRETEDIEFYDFTEGTVIDIDIFKNTQHLVSSEFSNRLRVGSNKSNNFKDNNQHYYSLANTVYNIEVANDHTYFVTKAGIWIHNTNSGKAREKLLGE